MGSKRAEVWRFTVTNLRTGRTVHVKVTAKTAADVADALAELQAPVKVMGHVRHHGVGMVRRFHWENAVRRVEGARI